MATASTTSPFAAASNEVPWILWQKKTAVIELNEAYKTESRSVLAKEKDVALIDHDGIENNVHQAPIQRKQYNAVLNRMKQANYKIGSFSDWKN